MHIAVPTEIKDHETRVALTPDGVHELVSDGHRVIVQAGAGTKAGFSDAQYAERGAFLVDDAAATWAAGDLVVKVKEPLPSEYPLLREQTALFTYLHLAANAPLTAALLERRVTSLAYETVQLPGGQLPLLQPMSEVAGCLATQVGAAQLSSAVGGPGLLLGGVPGVPPCSVVVLGGGTAGRSAADIAVGMGAEVTVIDSSLNALRRINDQFGGRIKQLVATRLTIAEAVAGADVVIGTVLVPGASTPRLVTHEMVTRMRPGSVLVDVAVDQGGCFEDTHPTTFSDPVFTVAGSTFYCVANMPASVGRTSTLALTQATLPYLRTVADLGWLDACRADPSLARGLTTSGGRLYQSGVAQAHALELSDLATLLESSGRQPHRVAE